jgi:beta-glucosidase
MQEPTEDDHTMEIENLLAELTLDEKASLTSGADMWRTPTLERVGLRAVKMTDGPNGARGDALLGLGDATACCMPCGAALGATWNPELIERVGSVLGQEARTKASRILLAPTLNLHRSPLGGRNFECYSEDPLLSGRTAAAFVRGVQGEGVATTAKHFVANDAEFERHSIDSVVDERTLRELYLLPFELAVKEGGSLGIMTAYNRLNGTYCSESAELLTQILREEWGFEGFVVTDWFSAGTTKESCEAGLDLQMPGPGRFFGKRLAEAVRAGEVDEACVDAQVRRMLSVWDRLGAQADPLDEQETSIDLPEHRAVAREAARESMVLLRNDGTLPLDRRALRRVALIGPNADRAQIMGGGSAALRPHYRVTPLEALRERLGDAVEIVHERGCWTEHTTPSIPSTDIASAAGGVGFDVEFFPNLDWSGEPAHRSAGCDSKLLYFGPPHEDLPAAGFSFRALGRFTPTDDGRHTFSLVQAGRARLLVNGEVVIDGVANPPPRGKAFFGMGSEEVEFEIPLRASEAVELEVQYSSEDSVFVQGVKIGHKPPLDDDILTRAVAAAGDADAVLMLVGTNGDWESEGHDRQSMDLPGDQDELIRRVCAANPKTVICLNSGSPVTMDWALEPAAILQTWFGGQEMSGALVDILFGEADPGGRLPTTIPIRLEHNPSFGNFPGENSELRYGEGLLVGYRWYETRGLPVRFPFGHGLSYTQFEIGEPRLSSDCHGPGSLLTVDVPVTNTGDRVGSEVVQCYVAPDAPMLFRPERELRAFGKVQLEPGESTTLTLTLDDRAFAYWDPGDATFAELQKRPGGTPQVVPAGGGGQRRLEAGWYVDAGTYRLHIGRSSAETAHICPVEVMKEFGPLSR